MEPGRSKTWWVWALCRPDAVVYRLLGTRLADGAATVLVAHVEVPPAGALEGAGFADPEPGAVAGEEESPILRGGDRAEHLPDLLDAQHGGQRVRPARAWNAGGQLRLLQRDPIEEAQGGRMHDLGRGADAPHVDQVGQVRADLVFSERGRRSPEVAGGRRGGAHGGGAGLFGLGAQPPSRLPPVPQLPPW